MRILFGIIAVLVLFLAWGQWNSANKYGSEGIKAVGVIKEITKERVRDRDDYTTGYKYIAEISFVDNKGEEIDVKKDLTVVNDKPTKNIGDDVELMYLDNNSQEVIFDSFFGRWGGFLISIVLGLAFLFAAIGGGKFNFNNKIKSN